MTGVTGAYSYAFDELDTSLTEVKEILKSGSITNDELRGVQSEIDRISFSLKQVNKHSLITLINAFSFLENLPSFIFWIQISYL